MSEINVFYADEGDKEQSTKAFGALAVMKAEGLDISIYFIHRGIEEMEESFIEKLNKNVAIAKGAFLYRDGEYIDFSPHVKHTASIPASPKLRNGRFLQEASKLLHTKMENFVCIFDDTYLRTERMFPGYDIKSVNLKDAAKTIKAMFPK